MPVRPRVFYKAYYLGKILKSIQMDKTLLSLAFLGAGVFLFLFHPRLFNRPLSPRMRWIIGLLQLAPLLLLIWLLGDPRMERRQTIERERLTPFLLDDSPSMDFPDGFSGGSRIESIQGWTEELPKGPSIGGSEKPSPILYLSDLVPTGRSNSDFAEALNALQGRYPQESLAAILFVSDGRDHSSREVLSVAKRIGVPIHTVGIGPTVGPNSLRAALLEVPEVAQPGSPFLVEWSIDSTLEKVQQAVARITFASVEVFRQEIELREGTDHRGDWVSITPIDPGVHTLRLEVEPTGGAAPPSVVQASVTVENSPPTLLVLESSPSRNVRSLTQAALDSGRYRVVRPVPTPEGSIGIWDLFRPDSDFDRPAPVPWEWESMRRLSAEEWESEIENLVSEAAVIVLGDRPWRGLPESFPRALDDSLSGSRAGVLALSGSEKDRELIPEGSLADLLNWMAGREESPSELQIHFPEAAAEQPALAPLWRDLERTRRLGPDSYFEQVPPAATPLILDDRDRPLVFSTPFGLGRSTLIALENLWSLAASSDSPADPRFLEGFWLGILDDLSRANRSGNVSIELRPESAAIGRQVSIQVRDPSLRPGPPVAGLRIRKGTGGWRNLILAPDPNWRGVGESVWIPREAGSYEIAYASGATIKRFEVVDRPTEAGDETQDPVFLRSLAEATGGRYHDFSDRAKVTEAIRPESRTFVRYEKSSLRHDAKVGALIAALFCLGWGVRRAFSLP